MDENNNTAGQSFVNYSSDTVITGTESDDYIFNVGDNVTINALGGNDSIENSSENVIIDAGDGDDSIDNRDFSNVSVNMGAGDDYIYNSHSYYPTIEGGDGADRIVVERGHYSYIDGGAGNDSILGEISTTEGSWAMGGYAVIDGGDGDDYINPISSDSASINGGAGNDTIITSGNDATITSGEGDDIISLNGASADNNLIQYDLGSGNDTIYGLNETSKISITAGAEYSSETSGDDVIITVGENKITVAGGASLSTINVINYEVTALEIDNTVNSTLITGTELDDSIDNSGENVTINGAAGNDYIYSAGINASINGGAGNDSIINFSASATLEGDYGDDYILNVDNNILIDGSYGNDTIINYGSNVTIKPGGGNDYVTSIDDNVLIDYTGGNDTIYGLNETSTLQIGGGSGAYEIFEGEKNIGILTGDYLVVLEDALLTTNTININGESVEVENKTISLASGGDIVEVLRDNVSVQGDAGDDTIFSIGKNNTINAGGGSNIVAMGSQTGSFVVLSGQTTVEGFNTGFGEGSDSVYITGDPAVDFKDEGLTFYEENSNDSLTLYNVNDTEKVYLYYSAIDWTRKGIFIPDDAWYSVTSSDFTDNSNEGLYFVGTSAKPNHGVDFSGISSALNITMNTDYDASPQFWVNNVHSIIGGASNTTITGSDKDDTIIAGSGATTINAGAGENLVNLEDAESALIQLAGNTTLEGFKTGFGEGSDTIYIDGDPAGVYFKDGVLAFGNSTDSLTLSDVTTTAKVNIYHERRQILNKGVFIAAGDWYKVEDSDLTVDAGEEVYFVGTAADPKAGVDFSGITQDLNVTIDTAYIDSEDYVPGTTTWINGVYSLRGGASNTTITGSDKDDTIIAGTGATTINAGAGENLVNLEDAQSALVVLAGNTTLEGFKTGFGEGTDTIYIPGEPAAVGFKDGVLAFGNSTDSLTLSDVTTTAKVNIYHERRQILNKGVFIAAGDWYKVEDSDLTVDAGEEVYFVGTAADPKAGVDFSGITQDLNVTIDTAYIDSEDYVPGTTTWINGVYSLRGGAGNTTITGSDKSDTIIAGTGATTIDGATGDDFISLGSAQALINYTSGSGNDTIYDLNENSTLQIGDGTGTYSTQVSGDDIIVNVGDGSILLKDARNKTKPIITGESGSSGGGSSGGGNSGGSGGGSVDIDDFDEEEIITITGGGKQDIDLSKEDYEVAYIEADALGNKNITLGGDNTVVVEDTGAKVNITASKGNDTIISSGEKVFVSLQGGNTDIFATGGKMTVSGYNPATGSGFHTDYEDILAAINDREIVFNEGNLTIGTAVVIDGDGGNHIVNLFNADGDLQKVGLAPQDGALNASKEKSDMILIADENSTLTGGSGNDSIYAFEGSHVDGGAGRNYIEMDKRDESAQGVTVALNNGKNTIANFNDGFDYESDKLFLGVKDTVDFKFNGTDLKVKVNNNLRGVVSNIADGVDFVNILTADANGDVKVVAAQKGAIITVDDELADFYTGNKSGVDFTNYAETLMVNLGSEETSLGTGEVLFNGINQVTVGSGLNTIIGSSANETLTGNSDGITEFVFRAGGGRDLIQNFNFDEDKINVGTDAVTDVRIIGEGNVRLQVGVSSDFLTIEDAQGKNFNINGFTAKVDRNIDFDNTANYFVATASNAILTVGNSVEGDAVIWLDNPDRNGSVFKGDIKTLDASNATVKTELAGNVLDNTILAGIGDASLWGGNGGNDLLIGGAGKNMFFYALNNGSDTVSGTNDGDTVYLSGVTLENIIGADFTDSAVAINFSDGGKLTVNDAGKDVGFTVGEQTFRVNDEHNGFELK